MATTPAMYLLPIFPLVLSLTIAMATLATTPDLTTITLATILAMATATMATTPAMCQLPIFLLVLSLITQTGTLATTPAAMYLQPIFPLILSQAMGTLASTPAAAVARATLRCPGGATATTCVGGRTSAGAGCTRDTGRQSAGPSATSSQSAWEETGTVEVATASSVDRMEVVEASDTTRDTTLDTTRDTIREEVTVEVVAS